MTDIDYTGMTLPGGMGEDDRSALTPYNRLTAQPRSFTAQAKEEYNRQSIDYQARVQTAQQKIQAYNTAVEAMARQKKPGSILGFLPDVIEKPLEKLASGLYWTYSKFVSQPVAFSFLYAREGLDRLRGDEDPLSTREVWNQARHFSPGQSFLLMFMTDEFAASKGLNMDDVNAGLTQDKLFNSGWGKYASGSIDFAVAWYADPAVLALRGVGKARQKTFTKPTSQIEDFNNNTLTSMANLVDGMRTRGGAPNAAFERDLSNNLISVRRSPNGDALVRALSSARPGQETLDVLRVSAGDISALMRLEQANADAAAAISAARRRVSLISSQALASANPNPMLRAAQEHVLAYEQRMMNLAEHQSGVLANAMNAQDSLQALNYNRFTTPIGTAYRSWVDRLPRYAGDGPIPTGNMFARVARFSFYQAPVRLFQLPFRAGRAWHEIAPPRYIDIRQDDAWRRVDAVLRDVRSLSKDQKDAIVSRFIRATPAQRGNTLQHIEAQVMKTMARNYGVSDDAARAMYDTYVARRASLSERNRNYSNADIDDPLNPGGTMKADSFHGDDGSIDSIHPILSSQLEQMHVLMDFGAMDSVLRHSGTNIGRALNGAKRITGATEEVLDVVNRYWKVSNLVSIRYGIRSISDDLLSQVARYGAFAMLSRVSEGSRNMANKVSRATWRKSAVDADEVQMALANAERRTLQEDMAQAVFRAERYPTQANQLAVQRVQESMDELDQGLVLLERRMGVRATERPMLYNINGQTVPFPSAYDGASGALFQREVANARSHEELLGVTAGRLQRMVPSGNFANIRASENAAGHLAAWHRVLSRQFANDPMVKFFLSGKNEEEALRWLRRTPEGQAHWDMLRVNYGTRHMSREDFVTRVAAEIDDMLPMGLPNRQTLVDNILEGKTVSLQHRLDEVPVAMRPQTVRSEIMDNPVGINALTYRIDNAIDGFYRMFNTMPAERLSRSPLFASLYREHVNDLLNLYSRQGVQTFGKAERERLAQVGRQRALADVKQFSFTLDHEARLAHAFRFASPFINSFMESANRWFRVMRDKPQVIAHAANLYNSPTRAGWVVDAEGNKLNPDGTVTDPVTGEKRLVPLSERSMTVQIPDWAQPIMEKLVGTAVPEMAIPMNSIIPTVQSTPIWNPGFGPFVQIPLSKFVDASPSMEEGMRQLGLLPFQSSSGMFTGPAWVGEAWRAATGNQAPFRGRDGYETDVLAVLRKMQHDYDNGKRSSPPSVEEARSSAQKMAGLRALHKLVLPFGGRYERGVSTRTVDGEHIPFATRDAEGNLTEVEAAGAEVNYKPVKFFVDRYHDMMTSDPSTALDKFLDKYGDSFFAFTMSLTKANSTIPATTGSLKAMEKYRELLKVVDPDLGGLITGPEGKGPYSRTAFAYQLETGTMTGENMREHMKPEEMVNEMSRRRGWYEYNKAMTGLQADLFDAGFQSYQDKGAEYFAEVKGQILRLMTSPRTPEGEENPHYNRAWEEDYNQQDRGFYDRRANDMMTVVAYFEELDAIESEDGNGRKTIFRSDIHGLRQYLENRQRVTQALFARNEAGGSDDINAKKNKDLKDAFILATIDMMERNTAFAELHNRYLSRDMGIDVFTVASRED